MKIYKPVNDYAVIDVETTEIADGEIPKTKFWGYADSAGYKYFATTRKLIKFLEKQSPKVLLHHANFDIIQMLVDGENPHILKSHNSKLIRCKIGYHFTQNTLAVFPESLAKIFKAFGYKKKSLKNLEARNYDDCVLGLECFLKLDAMFSELVNVSPLERGTIAGTAFRAIELVAGKMEKDLRFLDAYRGGRVEVFDTRICAKNDARFVKRTRKIHPLHDDAEIIPANCGKFDISSSYPMSFIDCPDSDELLHVKITTKDWHGPLFDALCSDMLVFPNGEFSSWVYRSNWEKYIEPLAEKTRLKIMSRHRINFEWLKRAVPVIRKIYETKQRSDGAIRLVCKLFLNSAYGRIGLRGENERARILNYEPDGDDIAVYFLGKNRWLAIDKLQREPRSNFPFAAFITDNARCRLYPAFKRNSALYGDTDSVFALCNADTFSGYIGNGIGNWEFLGEKTFCAINVKDYSFGDEIVRKGGDSFTEWTLKRFAKGGTAREILRSRKTALRKRIVLPNGETIPHTVN